jgi:hypothetical protein
VTLIYSAPSTAPQKTRASLLPLLIILFIASYGILTTLVVEQGRTIEAQRSLLREMLKDSTQLADLKGKLARADSEHSQGKPAAPAPRKEKEKASGNIGNAVPKTPSNEVRRPGKSARTSKQIPEKPAEDLQDVRRSTNII